MRLGIVSDVHMRSEDGDAVIEELSAVAAHFDGEFRADRVLVLGDLIEDEDAERDREHVRRVAGTLSRIDAPATYLLGNHDHANLSRAELGEILDQESFWGRIEGTDLLYLDSSAPERSGAQGSVGEDQLDFLDRTLPGMEDALVFVHHPIHYHDISENYWFAEHPERAFCGNKSEVNEVVEEHGTVLAAFNGHIHETDYTAYGGVHHFTINAVNKERRDVGVTGTYAEVTTGDHLSVRVVEGDRMAYEFEIPL